MATKKYKPRQAVKVSKDRISIVLSSDEKSEMVERAKKQKFKSLTEYILEKCLRDDKAIKETPENPETKIKLEYTTRLLEKAELDLTEKKQEIKDLQARYDDLNKAYYVATLPWYKRIGRVKELGNK